MDCLIRKYFGCDPMELSMEVYDAYLLRIGDIDARENPTDHRAKVERMRLKREREGW
jgi:hypothetical protein